MCLHLLLNALVRNIVFKIAQSTLRSEYVTVAKSAKNSINWYEYIT